MDTLSIGSPDLDAAIKAFGPRRANLSMAQALNAVAKRSINVIGDAAAEQYNVKPSAVKKVIVLKKAKPQNLEGMLLATSAKLPIIGFKGTRKNKAGIRVEILRGSPYKMAGRFITHVNNGRHRGAFERYGPKVLMTKGKNKGRMRQRIRELYGPALSQMIDHTEVIEDLVLYFNEELPPEFGKKLFARIKNDIRKAGLST